MAGSRVLVIDDQVSLAKSVQRLLGRFKIDVSLAHSGKEGLEILGKEPVDVVLLDIQMPEMDGIEVLTEIRKRWTDIPVIMMTGFATIETAVQAMKKGAFDFIQKPFDPDDIVSTMVLKALEHVRLLQRYANLQKEVQDRHRFENMVGKSRPMQAIFRTIERLSKSETTVLITGESGTGKELIARAIHYNSPRKNDSFVAVDLGALTENVVESELFGHVKGSFTGAITDHKGLFRMADGGTIFLDEIGEIPLKVQARLLRVLQEREIKPVGNSNTISVNVRVLAATNKSLEQLVGNGAFREDLYYRLRVIPIHVPPLRERREDIILLLNHFLQKHTKSDTPLKFAPEAMEIFSSYAWPGNVRELENCIERLLALADPGKVIQPGDLPSELRSGGVDTINNEPSLSLESYERLAILRALDEAEGDKDEAAKVLGIGKSTFYRKLKNHGISPKRNKS